MAASIRIWRGEIDNAFVFTGYGDHHAGKDSFGGGCCFNGAAIAIQQLRQQFGARRLAIVDTDAHHGNGTWEIFEDDAEVLYVCYCAGGRRDQNNKVNVQVPLRVSDEEYLRLVEGSFVPRARAFEPEAIFWNWGYDGTQGDYGDIGLTADAHLRLARALQRVIHPGPLPPSACEPDRRLAAEHTRPGIAAFVEVEGSLFQILVGRDREGETWSAAVSGGK